MRHRICVFKKNENQVIMKAPLKRLLDNLNIKVPTSEILDQPIKNPSPNILLPMAGAGWITKSNFQSNTYFYLSTRNSLCCQYEGGK